MLVPHFVQGASVAAESILYCLTRDRELAGDLDRRLAGVLAFFYNDAARLYQAIQLRAPALVLVDTDAIRPEYGDAGLGPVVDWLRHRAPAWGRTSNVAAGAEQLIAAEAGDGVQLVPSDVDGCVAAVAVRTA